MVIETEPSSRDHDARFRKEEIMTNPLFGTFVQSYMCEHILVSLRSGDPH